MKGQPSPKARFPVRAFLPTLLVAVAGGVLFRLLDLPLPWMLGPLVACAVANLRGAGLRWPPLLRDYGQWVIGTVLGLYFTPAVVHQVIGLAPWIAIGVVWAVALGLAYAWSLRRFAGVSRETAFFAGAIGGASEMALLGERAGARVDQIAASHSLRIVLVVMIVPLAYRALDLHGSDPYQMAARVFSPSGLLLLAVSTALAGALCRWLNWPNAWVLGPLAVSTALTASGHDLSVVPPECVVSAQIAIGASLGVRFTPAFFVQAPRYLGIVAATSLCGMLATAAFALVVARASGIAPATMVLATAPGGVAEMSLTAKVLQLGVPVVTAFHVVRMAAILMLTPRVYRAIGHWRGWRT